MAVFQWKSVLLTRQCWQSSARCLLATIGLASVVIAGCNVDTPADVQQALHQATHPADREEGADFNGNTPAHDRKSDTRIDWDAVYIQGSKVGQISTANSSWVNPANEALGQNIEFNFRAKLLRGGVAATQSIQLTSFEAPIGKLVRFTMEVGDGHGQSTTTGELKNGTLQLFTIGREGKKPGQNSPLRTAIAWPDGTGGLNALQQSLTTNPLQPGEKRQIKAFNVIYKQITATELSALEFQPTTLRDRTEDLLQIDCVEKIADQPDLQSTLWTNHAGEILKSHNPLVEQDIYRVTKREALTDSGAAAFDIVRDLSVKIDRPLHDPHSAKQMAYRVELKTSDPKQVFVDDLSQHVTIVDKHVAQLVVRAIRPEQPGKLDVAPRAPVAADREPNSLVQSDDPRVKQMAETAAAGETDFWKLACNLEKYVHDVIREKDFGSGDLVSAAEVAERPHGDCRAHAVLLTALARANKIPARAALGLVYVPQQQAFGFHMWTEMWSGDRWVPMDATLGRGGIGAGHIKLKVTNLSGIAPITAFLPVAQAAGQLKIQLLPPE